MGSEKSSEHRSSSCFYFVLILDLALGVAGEYLEMADGGVEMHRAEGARTAQPGSKPPRVRDARRRTHPRRTAHDRALGVARRRLN